MHICPIEIMAILSMIPVLRYFVKPCCKKALDKCHAHLKEHKHKRKMTLITKTVIFILWIHVKIDTFLVKWLKKNHEEQKSN